MPPTLGTSGHATAHQIPSLPRTCKIFGRIRSCRLTEGVSVFVSSGDSATAGCDQTNPPESAAEFGIAVNGFASTQYNVAVGGTDFGDTFAGTDSTYWNSSNSSTFGSAKSYIPEIPWNNSCANVLIATFLTGKGTTYGADGFCNSALGGAYLNVVGGGGPSTCATGGLANGTCTATAKPSWQSVFGNPKDGARDLPDVSLFAGSGVWGHAYVACWSDPLQIKNGSRPCTGTPDTWSRIGGTSVAVPIMAATQALVNQKTGIRWGNPNPTYYSLAAAEYGASGNANCSSSLGKNVASTCIFYDVNEGDMDVPCNTLFGSLSNCYQPSDTYGVLSTSTSIYQPAFSANTGWDFATGIGTINAANLVNNWTSTTGGAGFSLSPNPAAVNITAAGQSGSSTITVTGTGDFAGSVGFACGISPVPANDPPTCFVNPSPVALSATSNTATATLTISTTAGLNSGIQFQNPTNRWDYFAANGTLVLFCMFLLGMFQQKKRMRAFFGLALLLLVEFTLSSCGGGGGSNRINFGTPSGSYTVTVTASSGNTTQATSVVVNVGQ